MIKYAGIARFYKSCYFIFYTENNPFLVPSYKHIYCLMNYDKDTFAERLRLDDRSVIDEIYEMYHAKIFRFSVSYLKNEEDAYDIVQEVFIKLWENRLGLKKDTNFDAFLFTVAKNAVLSLFRKRATEQKYRSDLSSTEESEPNKIENDLDFEFLKKRYNQLIEKLPPKRKEIFILSREKGLTNKEIAFTKGISEKTVEDHLTKSLSFFKQHFSAIGMFTLLFFYLFIE